MRARFNIVSYNARAHKQQTHTHALWMCKNYFNSLRMQTNTDDVQFRTLPDNFGSTALWSVLDSFFFLLLVIVQYSFGSFKKLDIARKDATGCRYLSDSCQKQVMHAWKKRTDRRNATSLDGLSALLAFFVLFRLFKIGWQSNKYANVMR